MSSVMSKAARVRAALAGDAVDRPPFTVWYHFGLQHLSPELVADAHVEFGEAYDLDWLKVMNDFGYPMPDGVEVVTEARQLSLLPPLDVTTGLLGQQLRLVTHLAPRVLGRLLFFDTIFDAWSSLRRSVVKDAMGPFMRNEPAALERALAVVNENLVRYASASVQRGAAGIFLSVPAGSDALTLAEFERFVRPYAVEILESIRSEGGVALLHAHGAGLYMDRLLDLPVDALSWADRGAGPSLAEVRRKSSLALVGGIDHARFNRMTRAEIRTQIEDAIGQVGGRGLLLAAGCSIPPNAFVDLIRAARASAER